MTISVVVLAPLLILNIEKENNSLTEIIYIYIYILCIELLLKRYYFLQLKFMTFIFKDGGIVRC